MAAGPTERAMTPLYRVDRMATRVDSVPDGSELEGVRIVHTIPGGMACVRDEGVRTMSAGESFEELLFAEYKDVDVVVSLVDANDLLPDDEGNYAVYVPPGEPVIIPEMCYPKQGADAVTLQATGIPDESLSGGSFVAGMIVIGLAIAALVLLWKKLTD